MSFHIIDQQTAWRNRRLLASLSTVALLLLAIGTAVAGEVFLRGRVLDQAGKPVDGALVRLLGADLTVLTGSDGRWGIDEGRPTSVFPERVVSTSDIAWKGPGEPIAITVRAPTWVTALSFDVAGRQIGLANWLCKGSGVYPYTMPTATAMVSICSQACDRVAYQIRGNQAVLTFTTCTAAQAASQSGVLDLLGIEVPGYGPARIPLSTYQDPPGDERVTVLHATASVISADPTTFASVRSRLKGGEIVELATGHYGVFEQKSATGYPDWVVIRAAPGAMPTFDRVVFSNNASNSDGDFDARLCFQGLDILDGVVLRSARWVEFRQCTIKRVGDLIGSMENIQKTGVAIRYCRGIRIEACEITHCGNGINGTGNHLIYRKNKIHHCSQDGMHFLGGHDFLCEYNNAYNFDDGADDSEARQKRWNMHCDCIQMYPIYGSDEPSQWLADCTLRGNRFHQSESMAWMIQSKRQDQLKRFLIENNISTAVPGYMFHFKDACDGVVFRFNTFLIPPDGIRFTGLTGREFDTRGRGYQFVALPSWRPDTTFVEVYGNIMGGRNEFEGAKLRRCDNNLYYAGGGRNGLGEKSSGQPPFVDVTSLDAIPTSPAVAVTWVLPDQPTERHRVPFPAYDANGNRRADVTCLGAVDVNAKPPEVVVALASVKKSKGSSTKRLVVPSARATTSAVAKDVRAAWDVRLQAVLKAALTKQAWPGFTSRLTKGVVTVESMTPTGALSARMRPTGTITLSWVSLTDVELAELAESLIGRGDQEARLVAGFFCLLAERPEAADRHLESLGAPAEAVRGLFQEAARAR